jgi:hypothetical protein
MPAAIFRFVFGIQAFHAHNHKAEDCHSLYSNLFLVEKASQ